MQRRKRPTPDRIVRRDPAPAEPPPLVTPADRRRRRRWGASLAASLLVHAVALGALAWAATTFVRVATREAEPPVFVTLLAGDAETQPGAEPATPAPPAAAVAPRPAPAPPDPAAARERPTPPPTARRAPPERSPRPAPPPRPERASPVPATAAPAPAGAADGEADLAAGDLGARAAAPPAGPSTGADASRVYGEGEVDRIAAPVGGIRRPEYPARERMMGREGRVSLVVTVGADGGVRAVQVARSAGAAFDASAQRAVERTPFRAARVADRAVASTVTVSVSFELD